MTFLCAGCGKKTAEVKGTVTLHDGRLLPKGRIAFFAEDGRSGYGDIVDGTYSIPNAPIGQNVKVTVVTRHLVEEEQKRHGDHTTNKDKPFSLKDLPYNGPRPTPEQVQKALQQLEKTESFRYAGQTNPSVVAIPARYQVDSSTPLTFTITEGLQEIDITLEKE